MNQTPAAILILTAAILGYAATTGPTAIATTDAAGLPTTTTSTTGILMGLSGLILAIWGVISLIGASIRDRELMFDGSRPDLLGLLDPRRFGRSYQPVSSVPATRVNPTMEPGVVLSPEMKAQLAMASHLEGRDKTAIVEEALRRYMPRYENTKAA